MKTKKILTLFTIFYLFWVGEICYGQSIEELFPKALQLEEVKGELEKAIELYEMIIEISQDNRQAAAKAQLQLALCYEKLGNPLAFNAFQKVINKYTDQIEIVEIARTKIRENIPTKEIQDEPAKRNPVFKQVQLDINTNWQPWGEKPFDISPDGKTIVYIDNQRNATGNSQVQNKLFIADISGAPVNYLVEQPIFEREWLPRFSPDGKYIAFWGFNLRGAIYLIKKDGTGLKQISKDFSILKMGSYIWHPDSKHLIVLVDNEKLVTYNLVGEVTNTVKCEIGNEDIQLTGISPDGKWISYFSQWMDFSIGLVGDCWLISSTGDKKIRLTDYKGFDGFGAWLGKSYSYYFVSDRYTSPNIFRIEINPETGEKKRNPEQITFYSDATVFRPVVIKEKSELFHGLSRNTNQIIIPDDQSFNGFKTITTGNNTIISPDGTTIFFTGIDKNNKGIFAVPRNGGTVDKITGMVPYSDDSYNCKCVALSPDGSTIAFFKKINEILQVLYFVSTNDTTFFQSVVVRDVKGIALTWSPDSKKVAFTYNNRLFTLTAWSRNAEVLTKVENWEATSTRWSPDGKYIAGLVSDDEASTVVITSARNGKMEKLTLLDEPGKKEGLEWHPNSKKLNYMYHGNKNNGDGIREAFINGSPSVELINQPGVWDYVGKWDPSGLNYFFLGDRSDVRGYLLYKYNTETKRIIPVSYIPNLSLPAWNKDGKFMVLSREKIETRLWMMEGFE